VELFPYDGKSKPSDFSHLLKTIHGDRKSEFDIDGVVVLSPHRANSRFHAWSPLTDSDIESKARLKAHNHDSATVLQELLL
jgi:hypothetical protein